MSELEERDGGRSTPEPRVIVCAWCGRYGREQAAVRPHDTRVWEPVSHAFAAAAKKSGFASHGICPDCREREERDMDVGADGGGDGNVNVGSGAAAEFASAAPAAPAPPAPSVTARFTLFVGHADTVRGVQHTEQARRLVQHLVGQRCFLDVVDASQHPDQAEAAGVVVTPTLVREWPLPVARLFGSLDDEREARRVFGGAAAR